jgi:acyl carrier protein
MTTSTSIDDFVFGTIAGACNCDRNDITLDTDVADLGMDSLSLTTVAAHVEASYGCQFTDDQAQALLQRTRVRDIVEIVREAVGERASHPG